VVRWLGFGEIASDPRGEQAAPVLYLRVIPMGSEACAHCDTVLPFEALDYVTTDEWGGSVYRCAGACYP